MDFSFYLWSDIIEEFHSRGIICYDYTTSTHLTFFFFSLSEQITAVVFHCLALLNLVAFLDSSGSPWEKLVFVWVFYLAVSSALPHGFVVEGSMNFLLSHHLPYFQQIPMISL